MKKSKTKLFLLLGSAVLMGNLSYAQSISPQSINSNGSSMTQSNGSISFTVGELVVLTHTDSDGNTLGGGFTSGATVTTVSVKEPNPEVLTVKVFPNPTTDLVNIQITNSTIDQVIISITDLQGKEVFNGKYAAISNVIGINTAHYASGTYVLSLSDKNKQVLGTYKIIKQ